MTKKIVSSRRIIGDHAAGLNLPSRLPYLAPFRFLSGLAKDWGVPSYVKIWEVLDKGKPRDVYRWFHRILDNFLNYINKLDCICNNRYWESIWPSDAWPKDALRPPFDLPLWSIAPQVVLQRVYMLVKHTMVEVVHGAKKVVDFLAQH